MVNFGKDENRIKHFVEEENASFMGPERYEHFAIEWSKFDPEAPVKFEKFARRAVHALCDAAEQAVLAERQDQGGGLLGGGFGAFDNKFHDVVSPRQRVGFAG